MTRPMHELISTALEASMLIIAPPMWVHELTFRIVSFQQVCWSRTKWTSSSSHQNVICSRHDIAEKLLISCSTIITHSLVGTPWMIMVIPTPSPVGHLIWKLCISMVKSYLAQGYTQSMIVPIDGNSWLIALIPLPSPMGQFIECLCTYAGKCNFLSLEFGIQI
jgi:hypothetical protein